MKSNKRRSLCTRSLSLDHYHLNQQHDHYYCCLGPPGFLWPGFFFCILGFPRFNQAIDGRGKQTWDSREAFRQPQNLLDTMTLYFHYVITTVDNCREIYYYLADPFGGLCQLIQGALSYHRLMVVGFGGVGEFPFHHQSIRV